MRPLAIVLLLTSCAHADWPTKATDSLGHKASPTPILPYQVHLGSKYSPITGPMHHAWMNGAWTLTNVWGYRMNYEGRERQ